MTPLRAAGILAILFCAVAAVGINAPFTNASHERQYQTVGIGRTYIKDGGGALLTPRAPFANHAQPGGRETILRLEFPFHGVIGAAIAGVLGDAPWIWRTLSIVASVALIVLVRLACTRVASADGAIVGAAIFALSPLLLHFGQVPMPDVLSTLGMAAAFVAATAVTPRPLLSAALFALALLGKPTVLPFALPVLVAAISERWLAPFPERRQAPFGLVGTWCTLALAPLGLWALTGLHDPPGALNLFNVAASPDQQGFPGDFADPMFYVRVVSYVMFFGLGPLGCVLAARGAIGAPDRRLRLILIAAAVSLLATYLGLTRFMAREPQYTLPIVFWLALVAAAGWDRRPTLLRSRRVLAILVALQIVTVVWATLDLKADRLPHHAAVQALQQVLPADARVLQVSLSYGATPTGLLERTTLQYAPRARTIDASLQVYRTLGYTHVLFMDYTLRGTLLGRDRRWVLARDLEPQLWTYAHAHLPLVQASEHASLFALTPSP